MAHEIRNPLASISGSVQLLMEGEHVPPEERRLMGIVVREAERLGALLTDFLVFARPGKPELDQTDISSLLDEVADMVSADPRFSATRIIREYFPGIRMRVDRRQFRQALLNLVINGAEAMESGGVLRLGIDPAGSSIYVEDTGPGIPESIREKIFDPFFTTKDRGTGLGLATVHAIVEAHHGIVEVGPGRNGGTRVTVRLFRAGQAET
jgi:two-component system sensor histidine kinase PilS (NtrC family)